MSFLTFKSKKTFNNSIGGYQYYKNRIYCIPVKSTTPIVLGQALRAQFPLKKKQSWRETNPQTKSRSDPPRPLTIGRCPRQSHQMLVRQVFVVFLEIALYDVLVYIALLLYHLMEPVLSSLVSQSVVSSQEEETLDRAPPELERRKRLSLSRPQSYVSSI